MGGGSSSSSSNATTTKNTDKRLVVSDSGIGLSSDSSTVNITTSDQGSIQGALDIVRGSNDALQANYENLLVGTGQAFSGILSLAEKAMAGGFGSLDKSQGNVAALVDTAQSKGTLDNRTITILGISAAVVVGAFAVRK